MEFDFVATKKHFYLTITVMVICNFLLSFVLSPPQGPTNPDGGTSDVLYVLLYFIVFLIPLFFSVLTFTISVKNLQAGERKTIPILIISAFIAVIYIILLSIIIINKIRLFGV